MPRAGMCLDAGVHHGLRVARLVALVMAKPPKSNEVDYDIFIKLTAVIECDLDHAISRFGVIAIDVKDRRLGDMCGVCRVDRTAAQARRGRKTDLIIDDEMDRTARSVARKSRELERFHYDALTGKGGVAVEQQRENVAVNLFACFLFAVAEIVLTSTGHTFDDRINRLKMARVARKLDPQLAPGLGLAYADGALMIFYVALIGREIGMRRSLKHCEDSLRHGTGFGIADYVRQHIETAAMGHAHVNFVHSPRGRALDKLVEHRYGRLAALKRKTLLPKIFLMQKLLKLLSLDQLLQQLFLRLGGERHGIDKLLTDLTAYPVFLRVARNVAIFYTDLAAIGPA